MVALVLTNDEVARSIVGLLAIDMMHHSARRQWMTNCLLGQNAMCLLLFFVDVDLMVGGDDRFSQMMSQDKTERLTLRQTFVGMRLFRESCRAAATTVAQSIGHEGFIRYHGADFITADCGVLS